MTDRWRDHLPIHWMSRGIGLDGDLVCFVCGATWRDDEAEAFGNDYMHNIAAHVAKVDELSAMACFAKTGGARMAYFHGDINAPQIKVGACTAHLSPLNQLSEQWFISATHVEELAALYRRDWERKDAANG